MNKNQIKQTFTNKNIVQNEEMLDQYINFCFNNNQNKRIRCNETNISLTEEHHILPKYIFPSFKNLSTNKWNSVHLKRVDHLYVHFLLAQALKEKQGMLSAFSNMIGTRLSKDEILKKEFNELVDIETVEKVYVRGKKEASLKLNESMNQLQPSGLTKRQESILKCTETKNIIQPSGLTIHQESALKGAKTNFLKGRWFNIFNHEDELVHENIPRTVAYLYCQALIKSSKEKPVGSSSKSKIKLNEYNNLHLVGCYVQEVHPSEEVKLKRLEDKIVLFENVN